MSIEAMSFVMDLNPGNATRKLVLLGYANHAAKDGTAAFPGVETIARYACCDARTVRRHIGALVEAGYLREGDQGLVSHYKAWSRPIVYDVAMSPDRIKEWASGDRSGVRSQAAEQGARGGRAAAERKRGTDNLSGGQAGVDANAEIGTPDKMSGGQEVAPPDSSDRGPLTNDATPPDTRVTQTVLEPSREPSTTNPFPSADASGQAGGEQQGFDMEVQDAPKQTATFEEFYEVYPRKTARADARKAWGQALAKGVDPNVILEGARRFAADPNLPPPEEKERIKYPASWLRAECWDDEPLPPRVIDRRQRGPAYRDEQWLTAVPEPEVSIEEIDRTFGFGPDSATGTHG